MAVHHKPRIKYNDFVAGIDERTKCQHQRPAGAGCDEDFAIRMVIALIDILLQQI